MNVLLQMAMTPNGYIATTKDDTPWSDKEWHKYKNLVQKIGNIIIGRRTFELMSEGDDLQRIGNPLAVVVTKSKRAQSNTDRIVFVRSPKEALKVLQSRGYTTALVSGGGKLNVSFLKANLITEMYLDIEPNLFGEGVHLFSPTRFFSKLKLIDTRRYSPSGIQLHYKIVDTHI